MKYILDTNVVSALMGGDPIVVGRLGLLARPDVAVPQPVFAEIAYGIERLTRSKRKDRLRERFTLVRQELAVATWSGEVSDAFGSIKAALERAGSKIEDMDAAVAAHAYAVDGTLVTANVKHMGRIPGLTVIDWTTPE